MPETYAYNEDKMMAGIRKFREPEHCEVERPTTPVPAKPISRIVVERVAYLFGFSGPYLTGPSREYRLRPAREAIVLVLSKRYRYSLTRIGSVMHRHHTSIMNALSNAELRFKREPSFREKVELMLGEANDAVPVEDALAIFDLDRMRDDVERRLPETLRKIADHIESGAFEAKASLMAGSGPSHDPRAHCLVKIHLAAQIRKRMEVPA